MEISNNVTTVSFSTKKLSVAAEICSSVIDEYKKYPTPYRRAFIKSRAHKYLLGFTAEEIVEAIDDEMARGADGSTMEGKRSAAAPLSDAALRVKVKNAVWRTVNMAESRVVFRMFKENANEALKHIRQHLADEYRRTAAFILECYGYDLTPMDYESNIWLHLSARGTWKPFEGFRGDCSVYKWLKTVCCHCIKDYVEKMGYYPLIAPSPSGRLREDEDEATDFGDVSTWSWRRTRRTVRLEDYESLQVADSRSSYDKDCITDAPSFLLDRIEEMPWEDWEKEFVIDSVINHESPTALTAKYGAKAALLTGHSQPFTRTWTDNRNSRMKDDLAAYVKAYINSDRKVLREFAKRKHILETRRAKTARTA